MSFETKSMHITSINDNVFVDLGFEPEEAAVLKARSQRVIAVKLAIKDSLITELAAWIEANKFKQTEAAEALGVTRQRVVDVVNKKTTKFTIDALVGMLARAGKHIKLSVH